MNHWFKNSPKIISLALLFSLTFLFACGDSGGSDDGSSDGVSLQAVLNSLTIAGTNVSINESDKTGSVILPLGTDLSTAKPIGFTISTAAKLFFGDSSSTDEITADNNERVVVEGDNKFTVLAEDGETSNTYTITVAIEDSTSAVLNSLTIAGETVTIDESNKTGSVVLPVGTDLITAKTVEFSISINAKIYQCDGLGNAHDSNLLTSGNSYVFNWETNKITVVAEDGTTAAVYTIVVTNAITETHKMLIISLPPEFDSASNVNFTVPSAPGGAVYRVGKSENNKLLFLAASAGDYTVNADSGDNNVDIYITAVSASTPSAYTAEVFDYLPGVGQFTNDLPKWESGDDAAAMVAKVRAKLVGESAGMITLGGCLGYVTIGFDHTIMNVQGKCDFRIEGNAFQAANNPYQPEDGSPAPYGGSCEPGVLYVAYDKNKNGHPDDDEWYEIAGSSYSTAENEPWYDHLTDDGGKDTEVYRDYSITYHRPATEPTGNVDEYIQWDDNQGNSGWLPKNSFHNQSYYPQWLSGDSYTLTGVRLGQNGINESTTGAYFVLYGYSWGYVDNYPNGAPESAIDIDWAVDSSGNKVHLPGIDFVKIQNGVNQVNGWLGECSTEVVKGYDLHLRNIDVDSSFAQ